MKKQIKPRILPGFLELLPQDQVIFNKMVDIIKDVYEKHNFVPLDTPVIELEEILLAKCGGETEKQIYKIKKGDNDLALRFDLTVPLARYVSSYYNELAFPFRRYQISKVFRGEKPQKGRFREFYQCDIDIINNGELSIINDSEVLSIIYEVFDKLGFNDFVIKINNRKILNGFMESIKISDNTEVLRIIDKIEKIGVNEVKKELKDLGILHENIEKIIKFISIKGENNDVINMLENLKINNELFHLGVKELKQVVDNMKCFGVPKENYKIDVTIARGLDYYTGTVYETFLNECKELGSVCSGGRYENLTDCYINTPLKGVGISIGFSRLFWKLKEANLIKVDNIEEKKFLIIPMTDNIEYCIGLSNKLRDNNLICQVYLENEKPKKKFSYADKLKIPYVIIIGDDEIQKGVITLKNMKEGTQEELTINEFIKLNT